MSSSHGPFDDLLNLEEEYYREGYEEGLKDGAEAGRMEGYSLGLTKGFEKFVEAGRLQSKAVVWANRIPKYQQRRPQPQPREDTAAVTTSEQQPRGNLAPADGEVGAGMSTDADGSGGGVRLPPIHSNPRLEKNIETLYGLVEPGTLSTDNSDEAVNDFDSRIKGAHGKLRIIERAVGEGPTSRHATTATGPSSRPPTKSGNIEDVGEIRPTAETKSADAQAAST